LEITQLREQFLAEVLVFLSAVLWVMLRLSGSIQRVLENGKNLKVQVGKKEIIHLDQSGGNLNLEVLPTEKDIYLKVEGKKDPIRPEKEKIQAIEESDTPGTINLTLSKPTEKQDLLVKEVSQVRKKEKEVNIKKWL
jgi:hypothetical protein